MKDPIKLYIELRTKLTLEKSKLEKRLQEVNLALGDAPAATQPIVAAARRRQPAKVKNPMSLREAVVQVTTPGARTKQEILEGVRKLGYKFVSNDPMNSLNTILYGSKNPEFKNEDGKFSPGARRGGVASKADSKVAGTPAKKRTVSPATRARISAAQKERWGKSRAEKPAQP